MLFALQVCSSEYRLAASAPATVSLKSQLRLYRNASLIARAGCLPTRSPARRPVPISTRSSRPARRTASNRIAISSGCSRSFRSLQLPTTTLRFCRGSCPLLRISVGCPSKTAYFMVAAAGIPLLHSFPTILKGYETTTID
jgi:hypothetical protein